VTLAMGVRLLSWLGWTFHTLHGLTLWLLRSTQHQRQKAPKPVCRCMCGFGRCCDRFNPAQAPWLQRLPSKGRAL